MQSNQTKETVDRQGQEIESLKEKLAASEEARRFEAEESKSRDAELDRLRQLFATVQGQFASVSPSKPST